MENVIARVIRSGTLAIQVFLLLAIALSAQAIEPRQTEEAEIVRAYSKGLFGQVHLHIARPKAEVADEKTPLVLFHPTPYSGDFYRAYSLDLASDRLVIAMDTPGYGYSDRPPAPPTIAEYAENAAMVIDDLGLTEVDIGGYHTGALIATELAILRPELVRKLALSGVPYYVGEERQVAYDRNVKHMDVEEDGSHLDGLWKFAMIDRVEGVSKKRAAEHFADALLAGDKKWWAYKGVFTYEAEKQLPLVKQPTLIFNNHAGLKEHSQNAAKMIPNSTLVELPHLHEGIFDVAAPELAKVTREYLDRDN